MDMGNVMRTLLGAVGLGVAACGGHGSQPAPTPTVTKGDAITPAGLLGDIKILSSDSFQGRKPGTVGDDRTVAYLEREFKAAGFRPGNTDGTYIQKVPLVGITPDTTAALTIRGPSGFKDLRYKESVVAFTDRVADSVAVRESELVFVGYGVEAPE